MRWTLPLLLAFMPLSDAQAAPRDDFTVVMMSGNSTNTTSYGRSTGDEWRQAKSFQQGKQPLLYVRKNGAAYVIRNAEVLSRADAILKPQRDLGARQGALGAQQGELGRQQGAMGARQAQLGRQMAGGGARRAEALAAQMRELGRQQAALGERQAALGDRQAALGNQQARLADQSRPQFEALVDDAIRRGLAKRVN